MDQAATALDAVQPGHAAADGHGALHLVGAKVSASGAAELQKALPCCKIVCRELSIYAVMGFRMHDLLFAIVCMTIGMLGVSSLSSHFAGGLRIVMWIFAGLCVYLALIYPFYRGLKLLPMVLPRCPCCRNLQSGFHIIGGCWPRICFRCPSCDGEFVIWHDGKPGDDETWEMPVLLLKWPYAWGVYKRAQKPEADSAAGRDRAGRS